MAKGCAKSARGAVASVTTDEGTVLTDEGSARTDSPDDKAGPYGTGTRTACGSTVGVRATVGDVRETDAAGAWLAVPIDGAGDGPAIAVGGG